jgi:methyl-accepting chemotaxis protein WspA
MRISLGIGAKLIGSFAAILVIFLALLGLTYSSFARLSTANDADRHSMQVTEAIRKLHNDILQVQVESRGYYLTGDPERLAKARKEMSDLPATVLALGGLSRDSPAQFARFKRLEALVQQWSAEVIDAQLKLRESLGNTLGAADAMGRTAPLTAVNSASAQIYQLINEVAMHEGRLLSERSKAASATHNAMERVILFGSAGCLLLTVLIAWLLSRAILTPLGHLTRAVDALGRGQRGARAQVVGNDELGQVATSFNQMAGAIEGALAQEQATTASLKGDVDVLLSAVSLAAKGDFTGKITVSGNDAIGQLAAGLKLMLANLSKLLSGVQSAGILVNSSATEIAASAREQEATGVELAQTCVEILSTTKEISSNAALLLKTMEEVTAVADYTNSTTERAQGSLTQVDKTMLQMVNASDDISTKLASLSEKAARINTVLVTITRVADQTNLLSLNAAIEAESAGEAGRGFSVVATEIRRLADQTAVSTGDIEQMLKEMHESVSASVMGMDKFSQDVRQSVGEVRRVTDQLSGVMDQVQRLIPRFDVVLQGMQSQAVGAQQISETMGQLSAASQQSAQALKTTSEAVVQLQHAAGALQSSVALFAVA